MTKQKCFKFRLRGGLPLAALMVVGVAVAANLPAAPAGDQALPPAHAKGVAGLGLQVDVLGSGGAIADVPVVNPIIYDPFTDPAALMVDVAADVLCIQNGVQPGVSLELTDTNGRISLYQGFESIAYNYAPMGPVSALTLKVNTNTNPKCAAIPQITKQVTTDEGPVECAASDMLFGDGFENVGTGGAVGPNLQVDFRLLQHPNTSTGDPAVYEIHVTNCGDAAATSVGVRDLFPTLMAPPPKLLTGGTWECNAPTVCDGNQYINTVFPSIAAGGSRVITATRSLEAGVAGETIRVSAAAISLSATADAMPGNNSDSWEFEIRDNEIPTVTITGAADSLAEDDGTVTLSGVTVSAADSDGSIVSVAVTSLDTSILTIDSVDDSDPANVVVTVTTVTDAFGTATLEVIATDDLGGMSDATTFDVTVDPVNDPPTITVLGGFDYNDGSPTFAGPNCTEASASGCADQSYPFDVGAFPANYLDWVVQVTPGPANEAAQSTTVTIGPPSDPGLFLGSLFEPRLIDNVGSWILEYGLDGDSGTATLVITVDDGEAVNNQTTLSFDIFVDNAPPTVSVTGTSDNLSEDAGDVAVTGVTIAASDTDGSIDTVVVNSLTPSILTIDSVDYSNPADVVVTVSTVADAFGNATLEVIATDDSGADSTPVTVDVRVDAVNDPPTITVLGGFDYNGGTPTFAGPNCTETSAAGCANHDYPSDVGVYDANFQDWVIQVSPGPANEYQQTVTVSIGAPSDPGLFLGATFEPELIERTGGTWDLDYGLSGVSGTATVVITVDDGRVLDSESTLTFDIIVDAAP